jgi:SAM-dependent methyltransferase
MICAICGGQTERLFQKHGHWIRQCGSCGHQSADIAPSPEHVGKVYGDQYFCGGDAGYRDYVSDGAILVPYGRHYADLLARFMPPGSMLDVGAAAGFILKGFQESGWNGIGIEPNPLMADYARTHFGLRVESGVLEQFQSAERYDLISMIQVISHFYDVRKALEVAAEHTRPGGFWLIETWDRESWTARLFGRRWQEYSPPSVLHWFSVGGLQQLTSQFGFRQVARGRPAKRIVVGHAKSLLQYKLRGSALSKPVLGIVGLMPSTLSVPYPADDVFWALYQKSEGCC